jgi:hypothetical protein
MSVPAAESDTPPPPPRAPIDRDLLEAVEDLAHDLGRHIRLPLALLPIDAGPAQLREAVERGVRRTRTGPRGAYSAEDLLADFADEVPEALQPDLAELNAAVAAAMALLDAHSAETTRDAISGRLDAVGAAIAALQSRWRSTLGEGG